MKICVKHLVQQQAHSNNSVHYCFIIMMGRPHGTYCSLPKDPAYQQLFFHSSLFLSLLIFFLLRPWFALRPSDYLFLRGCLTFAVPTHHFLFFAFLLSLSTVHSFIPSLSFIHLFNKYLLKPAVCQALFTPCTNPLTPESTKTLRLSVLASSCEHRQACILTDHRRPRPMGDLGLWPLLDFCTRGQKQSFWSPRTMFKMKLAADNPTFNRDQSNRETLEQGQKQFLNYYVTYVLLNIILEASGQNVLQNSASNSSQASQVG